jgi:predicted AAA+ superfamily ATPase
MTWPKLDSTHSYEVDFLLSKGRNIIPIEVKSSRTVFHASLDAFCKKYSSLVKEPYMLSQKDISHDSSLRTYPFYLASCIGT